MCGDRINEYMLLVEESFLKHCRHTRGRSSGMLCGSGCLGRARYSQSRLTMKLFYIRRDGSLSHILIVLSDMDKIKPLKQECVEISVKFLLVTASSTVFSCKSLCCQLLEEEHNSTAADVRDLYRILLSVSKVN